MVPRFRDYMVLRNSENEVHLAVHRLYDQGVDPFAFLAGIREGYSVGDAMYLAEMTGAPPATPGAPPAAKPGPAQLKAAADALMAQLGQDKNALANLQMLMTASGVNAAPAPGSAVSGPVAGKPGAPVVTPPGGKPTGVAPPATPGANAPAQAAQRPAAPAPAPAGQPATPGANPAAPAPAPGQPQPKKPGQV